MTFRANNSDLIYIHRDIPLTSLHTHTAQFRIVLDETVIPEPDRVPKQSEHTMRVGGMSLTRCSILVTVRCRNGRVSSRKPIHAFTSEVGTSLLDQDCGSSRSNGNPEGSICVLGSRNQVFMSPFNALITARVHSYYTCRQ